MLDDILLQKEKMKQDDKLLTTLQSSMGKINHTASYHDVVDGLPDGESLQLGFSAQLFNN